jgi:ABC-type amino acid transport substrate-binding protein
MAAVSKGARIAAAALLLLLLMATSASATPKTRRMRRQAMSKYNQTNMPDGFQARPGLPGSRGFGAREFIAPGNDSNSRYLQKPYNICISDWAPTVQCKGIDDPMEYTGFQIEMFRYMAEEYGWLEGEDFEWHCMGWSEVGGLRPHQRCARAQCSSDGLPQWGGQAVLQF